MTTGPSSLRLPLTARDDPARRAPKPLGVTDAGPRRTVALPVADAHHHLHVAGTTGKGKSTALLNLALADITAGRGCAVIEPRGDLIRDLLDRIPASAAERVVLIDPDETHAPPALNILNPTTSDSRDGEMLAEHLVATLHRLYEQWWGPRVEDTLRAAALTLATQPDATLADVPLLLTNADYRRNATRTIRREDPAGTGAFWDSFDQLTPNQAAAALGPVLSKLRAVTTRSFVADLFGTVTSSFDAADILNGGVLLARLPKGQLGQDCAQLVGSLLVAALWQAVLARADTPEAERADATILIDEAHNFLHLPTPLDDALAESRGYRVGWVLAHQHLDQLTPAVRAALDANARNKLFFGTSPGDARHLAGHVAPHLGADDLTRLARFQAVARLSIGNRDHPAFTLRTLPAPPPVPGRADAIRAASRAHGVPGTDRRRRATRRRFTAPATDPQEEQPR